MRSGGLGEHTFSVDPGPDAKKALIMAVRVSKPYKC